MNAIAIVPRIACAAPSHPTTDADDALVMEAVSSPCRRDHAAMVSAIVSNRDRGPAGLGAAIQTGRA
jgi:hypothetical protein